MTVDCTIAQTLLNAWLEAVQTHVHQHRSKTLNLSFDKGGKKYLRVVESEGEHHRSVFCFIELSTGNILKASGWTTPAKGVRGNIADTNYSIGKGITAYGGAYAR